MAITAITVNGSKTLGMQLIALANAMRTVRSLGIDTQKLMANMNDGAVYTLLETQYGLSGNGAAVLATITSLNNQIAASTSFNLVCDNVVPLN
jgi:hypothetical protein